MKAKELAKRLQRDYIPSGKRISEEEAKELTFRATADDEVYQCGYSSSSDPQSGPMYCGRVADYISVTSSGVLTLCERHARYIGAELPATRV